jgi:hypothetical protein
MRSMPRVYHASHRSVSQQHGNLRRVSPDWGLAQGVGDGLGLGGAAGRGCCRAWGWAGCWPSGRYGPLVARWRGWLPFGAGVLLEDGEPVPPPCPAGDSEQGGVQARASCVAVVGIRTAAAVASVTRPRRRCMSVASVHRLCTYDDPRRANPARELTRRGEIGTRRLYGVPSTSRVALLRFSGVGPWSTARAVVVATPVPHPAIPLYPPHGRYREDDMQHHRHRCVITATGFP